MAVQMFLIHPKNNDDDHARETIAEFIAQRGGFVLMATSYGSLITAFDDTHLEAVKAHYLVEFAGGVTLNPGAPGTSLLQRLFAQNVATQLVERGIVPSNPMASAESPATTERLPSGYRPMRWPTRPNESMEEGGE